MAAAKDTTTAPPAEQPKTTEELQAEVDRLTRQLAERGNAPVPVVLQSPSGSEMSAIASAPTADRNKAVELLNHGCPNCHAVIRVYDFPAYVHGHPMLWPTLVFHYRVFHPGIEWPKAPDPEDAKVFDMVVEILDDGSWAGTPGLKVRVPYRDLFERAVKTWKPDEVRR